MLGGQAGGQTTFVDSGTGRAVPTRSDARKPQTVGSVTSWIKASQAEQVRQSAVSSVSWAPLVPHGSPAGARGAPETNTGVDESAGMSTDSYRVQPLR
jgi:hypothetical protein